MEPQCHRGRALGSSVMPDPLLLTRSLRDDPALDMALSTAALRAVAAGRHPPVVRLYRPAPTVAFSRRDRFEPGFEQACAVARAAGYTPLLRSAGGRAAAYDEQSLVLDRIVTAPDITDGIRRRFDDTAGTMAATLRALGLDARVGELPGEYCAGSHSINLGGVLKVAGTAQRVIRGAALVSCVLVVGSGPPLRELIADVYGALGLAHDPRVTGALQEIEPGLSIEAVAAALSDAFAPGASPVEPPDALVAAARGLTAAHRVG